MWYADMTSRWEIIFFSVSSENMKGLFHINASMLPHRAANIIQRFGRHFPTRAHTHTHTHTHTRTLLPHSWHGVWRKYVFIGSTLYLINGLNFALSYRILFQKTFFLSYFLPILDQIPPVTTIQVFIKSF